MQFERTLLRAPRAKLACTRRLKALPPSRLHFRSGARSMSQLRADLWCAAYVRRQNDLGRICVIARRGDPIAGQIWVELDHLDGTASLFAPAPGLLYAEERSSDRLFQTRLDKVPHAEIAQRLAREAEFDPDFWLIALESRDKDPGLDLVAGS